MVCAQVKYFLLSSIVYYGVLKEELDSIDPITRLIMLVSFCTPKKVWSISLRIFRFSVISFIYVYIVILELEG